MPQLTWICKINPIFLISRAFYELTRRLHEGQLVNEAFDSVNHRLLLLDLRASGIRSKLLKWVGEFLSGRMLRPSRRG